MRKPPQHYISKDAVFVWRVSSLLSVSFLWVGLIIFTYFSRRFDLISFRYLLLIWISLLLLTVVVSMLIPYIRWKRWRYEVLDQEIDLQRGVWVVSRTLIPMVRVQHVDTIQGPLLRMKKLATVVISTAATKHSIPALDEKEADQLRDQISRLARVDDDDV
ncbi:PH domain-containing protein [Bacillaceae bacterium S4-13-58]